MDFYVRGIVAWKNTCYLCFLSQKRLTSDEAVLSHGVLVSGGNCEIAMDTVEHDDFCALLLHVKIFNVSGEKTLVEVQIARATPHNFVQQQISFG